MIGISVTFASAFVVGLLAHLVADWFFQNEWQAANKNNLTHPAAWLHFGAHAACMLAVWPWHAALIVAVTHALIDTRKPLIWWRARLRMTSYSPNASAQQNAMAVHVALWQDQAAHAIVLGIVAACVWGVA